MYVNLKVREKATTVEQINLLRQGSILNGGVFVNMFILAYLLRETLSIEI